MPTPQYEDVYEPPMLDITGQAIANAIQGLNPTVPSFISDAFSVERSYSTGDIVIYENKVYVFTSNKSAGAWDSTKVTETTIGAICTATNASLTQNVTFTPASGVTVTNTSITQNGDGVLGSLEVQVTATQNTWVTIGTISKKPTNAIYVPVVRTGNGSFSGMVRIGKENTNRVEVYSTQTLSANGIAFEVAYKTNE